MAIRKKQSAKTRKNKGRKSKQLAVGNWHLAKTRKSKTKRKRQNKKKQSSHGAPGSSTVSTQQSVKPRKGKGKRQNREKQTAKNKKRTRSSSSITQSPTHQLTKFGSASFALPKTRLTHFRELRGKIIEDVLFSAAPDHQDITIKLQDKTGLSFSIATGLILKTEYSDWTSGEQRILRSWVLKKAAIGN